MKPARRQSVSAVHQTSLADERPRSGIPTLLVACVLVAAIVVLVHWPVLNAQAISFDDEETIVQNPLVQNPSWESVRRFFSEVRLSSVVPGYYRPLTLTSLMLDWGMGGRPDNFRPFHRTSLALHVGSTLLLVVLCYQLFGRPAIAAGVGLIFGLHPLTIEPIAWVMERKTVLAAFFAFACICAYVRHAHTGRWRWLICAAVLYSLSLLSKPTSTPLPLMLLLLDYWPLRRLSWRALLEKIPFFVLAAVFAVLAVLCEKPVNNLSVPATLSPLHLPLRICWLAVFYLSKIVLPINLSSAYRLPEPLSLNNTIVVLAVAGTIALIVGAIVSRPWTPAIWVGMSIFFLGLAPTMGVVGYSWVVASDKYAYLPAVGLAVMLAGLLVLSVYDTAGRLRPPAAAIAAAVILFAASAEALLTRSELYYWRDTESLYTRMLKATPDSAPLHIGLGVTLSERGRKQEAFTHLARALELDPKSHTAHNNYGSALAEQGRIHEAIRHYLIALRIKPKHKATLNNLAWDLSVHDFDQPPTHLDPIALAGEACRLAGYRSPTFLDTLAAAYANAGRFPEAVETARKAVSEAIAMGQAGLARDIEGRLKLYLANRPYRERVQTSLPGQPEDRSP